MFDVQTGAEAPADYLFQVRLILACRRVALHESELHLVVEALGERRSASECATAVIDATSKVRTTPHLWDGQEVEYP
jgi:hypothetical protein